MVLQQKHMPHEQPFMRSHIFELSTYADILEINFYVYVLTTGCRAHDLPLNIFGLILLSLLDTPKIVEKTN